MRKRIFTYWVNKKRNGLPAYIQLCVETWIRKIPDVEIVVINHDNIREWLGDTIDYKRFLQVSLPMQSDIVQVAVLEKYGGVFLDADTIITKDIFELISADAIKADKLTVFGMAKISKKSFGWGVMISPNPHNVALQAMKQIQRERLSAVSLEDDAKLSWDNFGNAVSNIAITEMGLSDHFHVVDIIEEGSLLEGVFFPNDKLSPARYNKFYFSENSITLNEVFEKIKFGIVLLHNSWASEEYKNLTLSETINHPSMLSSMLNCILGDMSNKSTDDLFLNSLKISEHGISGAENISSVQLNDVNLYVLNEDYIGEIIKRSKSYYAKAHLKKWEGCFKGSSCVIDIGAHIGNHTVYFNKQADCAKVIAFEPIKKAYNVLCKNIEENNINAEAYNLALSSKNGFLEINSFSDKNIGSTKFKNADRKTPYRAITLDSFLEGKDLSIDFIKISAGGLEAEVLRGMRESFKNGLKPQYIWVEIQRENIDGVITVLDNYCYRLLDYSITHPKGLSFYAVFEYGSISGQHTIKLLDDLCTAKANGASI